MNELKSGDSNGNNRSLKVLITGSARGIGRSAAIKYLEEGCSVFGFDVLPGTITHNAYTHYIVDVSRPETLPNFAKDGPSGLCESERERGTDLRFGEESSSDTPLPPPNVIFICAGVQNSPDDIMINLKGAINVTEKYAFQPEIRSVLFCASASAHTGFEFPEYVASKAGLIGYMKNVAVRLAPYGAIANSISPGGVITESNDPVMRDPALWTKIMDVTPLKKWATEQEIADWVWFLTAVNRSASGIDILIDNGESNLASTFVWPEQPNPK
jgi:3-oxoacyl-[acyl-carrier protein] reductase